MKNYTPTDEVERINYSKENPLKEFSILILGALILLGSLYLGVGFLGETIAVRLDPATESKIFSKLGLSEDLPVENNADFSEIENFFEFAKTQGLPFLKLKELKDPQMNAFAIPGGKIYLTTGLLEKIKSKMGRAFVLGHEIGHFKHRDHLRGLGRAIAFFMVGTVLGISNSGMGNTGMIESLVQKTYGRDQEIAADDFALDLMQKFYGTTKGADEFFNKILADQSNFANRIPSILSTHPHPKDRLDRINRL